jgi:hypothetical protein
MQQGCEPHSESSNTPIAPQAIPAITHMDNCSPSTSHATTAACTTSVFENAVPTTKLP